MHQINWKKIIPQRNLLYFVKNAKKNLKVIQTQENIKGKFMESLNQFGMGMLVFIVDKNIGLK